MEKHKDTDRHVAKRKMINLGLPAHEKVLKIQRALEVKTGLKVTLVSTIDWALTKVAKELRAK